MTRVLFHRLAAKEARKAETWYAERSLEAAAKFRLAIADAEQRIAQNPGIHPHLSARFQIARLKRFPYILVFEKKSATDILVIAVAHSRRRPNYWRARK